MSACYFRHLHNVIAIPVALIHQGAQFFDVIY
jgi:hypothetical protein